MGKCLELIQDLISKSGTTTTISTTSASTSIGHGSVLSSLSSSTSMPCSPNGVLDSAACLSYKSDERSVAISPHSKRRRLDQETPKNGGS